MGGERNKINVTNFDDDDDMWKSVIKTLTETMMTMTIKEKGSLDRMKMPENFILNEL